MTDKWSRSGLIVYNGMDDSVCCTNTVEQAEIIVSAVNQCQWRDIKTAPKDGSCILVYIQSPVTGDKWMCVVAYNDIQEMFMSGSMMVGHDFITHWMPLPPCPEGKSND